MVSQKAIFQTIGNSEDKDTHCQVPINWAAIVITVIMAHTQKALSDMHWLSALSTTKGKTTIITDVGKM